MIANPTAQQLKAREYNREWRRRNAARDSAWHKAYYAKHRKTLRAKQNAYRKDYYRDHPEKSVQYQFKKKYGLTLTQHTAMVKRQGGKCAICHKVKKLNVDHCHRTGRIRGLLCTSCNTALGAFGDSIRTVKVALGYLKRTT